MESAREKRLFLVVLAALIFAYAVALWPELTITRLDKNDNVSHFTLIQGMVDAIEQGRNPLDFWSPETVFGYPEIRVYQPLAHIIVVAVYFALGKAVSLMTIFVWVRYLSLLLLPISFYAAARLIELPRLEAAAFAAFAPLISASGLYGLEWSSYLWSGFGMFPQLVASHLWLLAIGVGFQAIRTGKYLVLAGVLLGLTALTEFVYGYMGAVTLGLLVLMPDPELRRGIRLLRTAFIGAVSLVLSFFQVLPPLLDSAIMNRSVFEPDWKWNSFGAPQVLAWLFKGELLDFRRLPVLSLLALAGAALILVQVGKKVPLVPATRFLVWGAVVWIPIFFGRPFWGKLVLLFGVPPDMPLHRVVSAVQIFLLLLASVGLAGLGRSVARRWGIWVAASVAAVLLAPVILERAQYFSYNTDLGQRNLADYASQQTALNSVLASLPQRGGRTYPGLITSWGKLFNVGTVPMFFILTENQIPTVSYLAHSLAIPGDTVVDFDELRPEHYRLFNIKTLLAPAKYKQSVPKLLKPVLDAGPFAVFDAPGGGYFDVVDAPVAVRADKQTVYGINKPWMHSDWPQHRTHLLLDFFGDAPQGLPHINAGDKLPPMAFPATEPGQVTSEQDNGDVYQAQVSVSRASFVLFKMTWHPDWKVLVDGQPIKTVMLSPGFVGAPVPAGLHRVWCRYEPGNWKLQLAGAGLFCVVVLGLFEKRGFLSALGTKQPVPLTEPAVPQVQTVSNSGKVSRTNPRKRRASLK